jgi:beta-galactosidase
MMEVFGLWNESIDGLWDEDRNSFVMAEGAPLKGEYEVRELCALIHPSTAKVLASYGSDFYKGEPALTVNDYGKGKVYFVSCALEHHASTTPAFTDGENAEDYYRFYKAMNLRNPIKVASSQSATIGLTEHIADDASRYILLINYEPYGQVAEVKLEGGYAPEWIKSVDSDAKIIDFKDGVARVELSANSGAAIKITK